MVWERKGERLEGWVQLTATVNHCRRRVKTPKHLEGYFYPECLACPETLIQNEHNTRMRQLAMKIPHRWAAVPVQIHPQFPVTQKQHFCWYKYSESWTATLHSRTEWHLWMQSVPEVSQCNITCHIKCNQTKNSCKLTIDALVDSTCNRFLLSAATIVTSLREKRTSVSRFRATAEVVWTWSVSHS